MAPVVRLEGSGRSGSGGDQALEPAAPVVGTVAPARDAWLGPDPRARAWQVFFPTEARYQALEAAGLSGPAASGHRVLVAWDRSTAALPDLQGWDGLVVARGPLPATRDLLAAGFTWVRRFVVLPGLADARWYLPSGDPRISAAALAIYTPYRTAARAKKLGLRVAARLGAAGRLGDELLLARRGTPALTETVRGLFPDLDPPLVLNAGRRERAFKLSAGILGGDGRLLAVARLCRVGEERQALIEREAGLLRQLAARFPIDPVAPELLLAGRRGDLYLTVQGALDGRAGDRAMTAAHRRFLDGLQEGPPRPASEAALVRDLHGRADRWFTADARFRRLLAQLDGELALLTLPRAIVHGDFAPWNVRFREGRLRAFDWEYGSLDGLPHLDALHYELQVGRLLERWSPDRMTAQVRAFAARDPLARGPAAALSVARLYLADRCLRMAEETGDPHHPDAREYLELWERLADDATIAAGR